MPLGFVFDANKCTGCQACQLACVIENRLQPDGGWRQILTFNARHCPGVPLFHLSLACNHCAAPACMHACPALAYSKDATTGVVLLDEARCIGCRYCTWACPYDAPRYDRARRVVHKCTLCAHRLEAGLRPACVDQCPTGALQLANLDARELTKEAEGLPTTELSPSIKIIPFREHLTNHQRGRSPGNSRRILGRQQPASRISLAAEWSLAVFTYVTSLLFGFIGAAVLWDEGVSAVLFAGLAAMALLLAAWHLGQPLRMWRAGLNLRRSWLSREAVSYALFVGAGSLYLAFPAAALLGVVAVLMGILTLLSVDRVYQFAIPAGPAVHSSSALLTGPFIVAVLAGVPTLAAILALVKVILYGARKVALARDGRPVSVTVAAIRLAFGFAAPAVIWLALGPHLMALVAVLLGELVDRCEFYSEIDVLTPERQMAEDLEKRVAAFARVGVGS